MQNIIRALCATSLFGVSMKARWVFRFVTAARHPPSLCALWIASPGAGSHSPSLLPGHSTWTRPSHRARAFVLQIVRFSLHQQEEGAAWAPQRLVARGHSTLPCATRECHTGKFLSVRDIVESSTARTRRFVNFELLPIAHPRSWGPAQSPLRCPVPFRGLALADLDML